MSEIRDWEPGDGVVCNFAKAAPLELPCGKPVKTSVQVVSAVGRRDMTVKRALCKHHARGQIEGRDFTPTFVVARAKKVAAERLVHEHWEEYQRYVADAVDAAANEEASDD